MKRLTIAIITLCLLSCNNTPKATTRTATNVECMSPELQEWLVNQDNPELWAKRINKLDEKKYKEFISLLTWRVQLSNDIAKAAQETNENLGYEAVKMRY